MASQKSICPKCHTRFNEPTERCPNDNKRPVEDLTGMVLADRYVLKTLIGVGGMNSTVWEAWQKSTERKVAVKVLPPADGPAAGRFSRGARIASNLNHPHITIVHDYGQDPEGRLFLVMELLEGHTLHRVLKESGGLPIERALHMTDHVLKALEAAHRQRIVHRDLKPGNLFLVKRNDDNDYVKVLDFGIAKYVMENPEDGSEDAPPEGNEVTQERQVCGTPHYMAPEQVAMGKVDARTDIYALGVVLYRMLTGRLPFEGKSHHDLFRQHLTEEVPTFADIRPDLDLAESLEALVRKSLAKNPDDRFQSAAEMRAALRVVRRHLGVFSGDPDDSSSVWGAGSLPPWQSQISSTITPPPPSRPSRSGLWIGLAIALAAVLGAAWWLQRDQGLTGTQVAGDPAGGAAIGQQKPSTPEQPGEAVAANTPARPAEAAKPEAAPAAKPAAQPIDAKVMAYVQLLSQPSGATVLQDGRVVGTTPLKLPVVPGSVKLTLSKQGFISEVLPLDLTRSAGQIVQQSVVLAPLPQAAPPEVAVRPEAKPAEKPTARRRSRSSERPGRSRRVARAEPEPEPTPPPEPVVAAPPPAEPAPKPVAATPPPPRPAAGGLAPLGESGGIAAGDAPRKARAGSPAIQALDEDGGSKRRKTGPSVKVDALGADEDDKPRRKAPPVNVDLIEE